MLTSLVGFAAAAAFIGALRRRPYRRDLMLLGALLPLGVVAQIVLGGFTVLFDLAPGLVMSHFMLSMLILVACVLLDWRARREPGELALAGDGDRVLKRASWGLFALGAVTIFAGTAATAAGPHTGGTGTDDLVPRLVFKGSDTLNWVISQHARLATLLGLVAVGMWVVARRRGATRESLGPLTWLCVLLAAQGVIGGVQYQLELPAEIVWVHASLAAATWVAIVLTVVAAGGMRAWAPTPDAAAMPRRPYPPAALRAATAPPRRAEGQLRPGANVARTVSAATSVAPLTMAIPNTL